MLAWPWDLFPPASERFRLGAVTITGGVSVGGQVRMSRTDGGGLWVCEAGEIDLFGRSTIKTARALEAQMDGGCTPIVVPAFEYPFQPRVDDTVSVGVGHSDGSTFSDGSLYASRAMEAVLAEAAALRATRLIVMPIRLGPLEGGERFTIDHPTRGPRLYTIATVAAPDEAGAVEITIRPPLREAASAGADVDFDHPRCVMRLANPNEWLSALDALHEMTATPVWVEAF